MNIERIAIDTHLRSSWQAADLGLTAGRTWWWPMLLCWVGLPGALFALLNILLTGHPYWSLLIVWWLKPLWDRLPLFFISRALFGEVLTIKQVYRHIPGIMKIDWLPWLLWRRFSPARSFVMPVTLLERCRGQTRGKRLSALQSDNAFPPSGCTFILLHLEQLLPWALLGTVWMFLPQWEELDFFVLWETYSNSPALQWLMCWLYFLAMAVVAPFYVATGFMLYINRRIALEGWDIEIRFRKMLQRRNKHSATLTGLLLGLIMVGGVQAPSANAQPSTPEVAPAPLSAQEHARQDILEIYNGEDFSNKKTISQWQEKDRTRDEPAELPEWLEDWLSNLFTASEGSNFMPIAASIMEAVLWLLVAILVIVLLWRYRHVINDLSFSLPQQTSKSDKPSVLFGMEVKPESLPEDVAGTAKNLIHNGQLKEALQLLYRASLSQLITAFEVPLKDSLTELECAQQSRQSLANLPLPDYFSRLTQTWLAVSYAHRTAQADDILPLAEQWPEHFSKGGSNG